ncbi:MAG: CDP-alcohol phosphatidyltransferase family protein [Candidatus Kerfeldbacteria bacterium]|nr:CDP-alcohol phosphatidyltransferase family protein [Candidatus Kerfeldbacteria bacterium]
METGPVTEFKATHLHELMARVFGPLARWCARVGIDPNVFTYTSVGFAAFSAVMIWLDHWFLAGIFLLCNGACDVLDGILARSMPERSERLRQKGAFLDPAVDRINDGFLFIGLILYGVEEIISVWPTHLGGYRFFLIALIAAAIAHPISSYYRARIESLNLRFQQKKPLTRAGLHVALGFVIIGMWLINGPWRHEFFFWSVTLCVSLPTIINLVRRFRHSLKIFDEHYQ